MATKTPTRKRKNEPHTAKIYTKKSGTKTISREAFNRRVNELAYSYYIERGVQAGSQMDDWLKAEADLLKRFKIAS